MKTQVKGDLAVSRAIFIFTTLGYNISVPITESAQYDLIIENGEGIFKIQVKYTSKDQIDLRRIHSNSKGYVVKKYTGGFDWLFIYHADKGDYLIKESLINRSTININNSYKL